MLHDGDKQKARLLQRFAPMAAQTTEQGVPPEKVNIATGKTSGQGPVGFSAVMLPFYRTTRPGRCNASASPITIPARMPTTAQF